MAITFSSGMKLTSARLNALVPTLAQKTSTESVTSSTTLQNDDQLAVSVLANAGYRLTAVIRYDGVTGGDIKIGWTGPSGCAFDYAANALGTAAVVYTDDQQFPGNISSTPTFGAVGVGTTASIHIEGLVEVGATSGTLQFQWAQGTSNATATRVLGDSYIVLQRLT